MKTVYVEASILSYLTARPSRDLLAAARRMITRDWWDGQRARFEVFISPLVEQEARRGDAEAAQRRGDSLRGLAVLEVVEAAYDLAAALITERALQPSAEDDATHIALAAVHGYRLPADLEMPSPRQRRDQTHRTLHLCDARLHLPEICTPEELMGEEHEC